MSYKDLRRGVTISYRWDYNTAFDVYDLLAEAGYYVHLEITPVHGYILTTAIK